MLTLFISTQVSEHCLFVEGMWQIPATILKDFFMIWFIHTQRMYAYTYSDFILNYM